MQSLSCAPVLDLPPRTSTNVAACVRNKRQARTAVRSCGTRRMGMQPRSSMAGVCYLRSTCGTRPGEAQPADRQQNPRRSCPGTIMPRDDHGEHHMEHGMTATGTSRDALACFGGSSVISGSAVARLARRSALSNPANWKRLAALTTVPARRHLFLASSCSPLWPKWRSSSFIGAESLIGGT